MTPLGIVFTALAILVASGSLAISAVSLRRKAGSDETQSLRERGADRDRQLDQVKAELIQMGRELQECKEARWEMQRQNFDLLMELRQLQKGQQ